MSSRPTKEELKKQIKSLTDVLNEERQNHANDHIKLKGKLGNAEGKLTSVQLELKETQTKLNNAQYAFRRAISSVEACIACCNIDEIDLGTWTESEIKANKEKLEGMLDSERAILHIQKILNEAMPF